ncbi:hypothetical protein [Streptomyces sp. I05A-00742]|uniref:hypothetical protein n=1 Tax=Streptomyces sp. I05A-00742 TaxID=2732853 RepID=UPI001488DC19|nr:hypothetical protein [Streptomyces sp. I05A-00742]
MSVRDRRAAAAGGAAQGRRPGRDAYKERTSLAGELEDDGRDAAGRPAGIGARVPASLTDVVSLTDVMSSARRGR